MFYLIPSDFKTMLINVYISDFQKNFMVNVDGLRLTNILSVLISHQINADSILLMLM